VRLGSLRVGRGHTEPNDTGLSLHTFSVCWFPFKSNRKRAADILHSPARYEPVKSLVGFSVEVKPNGKRLIISHRDEEIPSPSGNPFRNKSWTLCWLRPRPSTAISERAFQNHREYLPQESTLRALKRENKQKTVALWSDLTQSTALVLKRVGGITGWLLRTSTEARKPNSPSTGRVGQTDPEPPSLYRF